MPGSAYSLPPWRGGRGWGGLELCLRKCLGLRGLQYPYECGHICVLQDAHKADRIPVASPAKRLRRESPRASQISRASIPPHTTHCHSFLKVSSYKPQMVQVFASLIPSAAVVLRGTSTRLPHIIPFCKHCP